jgi:hypothetical protein
MENTSGHGQFTTVPRELKRWNWGAFWLTWIWGLFNGVYISLLGLIPIINIFMSFYLGAKGNELAWRNRYWYREIDFLKTQKKWAIAGWIAGILFWSGVISSEVDKYREIKMSDGLAKEAIAILVKDERAGEITGNNYSIKYNMGRTSFTTYIETQYVSHSFVMETEKGLFMVKSSLREGSKITKVEISDFSSNGSNLKRMEVEVKTD